MVTCKQKLLFIRINVDWNRSHSVVPDNVSSILQSKSKWIYKSGQVQFAPNKVNINEWMGGFTIIHLPVETEGKKNKNVEVGIEGYNLNLRTVLSAWFFLHLMLLFVVLPIQAEAQSGSFKFQKSCFHKPEQLKSVRRGIRHPVSWSFNSCLHATTFFEMMKLARRL